MAKALIRKSTLPDPAYPWYFSVDTDAGDCIDYGSQPTWAEAMATVEYVFTHREQFENAGVP